jgi:signal transduction histidine kinase
MSIEQDLNHILSCFDPSYLPIGIYAVTPEGQFILCNAYARRLLELPADGSITKKIGDFYADPSAREKLLQRVLDAEAQGGYLENEIIHFNINGRDVYVQNNCRAVRHAETNELIGYMGSLVDITDEHRYLAINQALAQRNLELTTDIGRVLHANTSTLVMVQQTLDVAIRALGPNPFGDSVSPSFEDVDHVLANPAQEAATKLEKLLQLPRDEARLEALSATLWSELEEQLLLLRDFIDNIPIQESRASALRTVARRLREICGQIPPRKLPRELTRDLLQAATNLERITALYEVLKTRTAVLQMDYTIRAFREFITADVRKTETPQRLQVAKLIEAAIKQLTEFAHSSRVTLKPNNEAGDAVVVGVERELVRALANLLHNAIKYSWHRDRGKSPWVGIRTCRENNNIRIVVENWGVPIGPNELENRLIFQLGYRGKWSKDRGRLGTGIGLTDTLEVARKHHGDLKVESRPARAYSSLTPESDEYFNQPFLTTVTLCLPEA